MAKDTETRVRNILGELRNLGKARELFAELNYDPAHDPISRQGWGESIANTLAEDPQIIACHDDFKIIYARLGSDGLFLGDERPIVNKLLQGCPYLLCLFSDRQQQQWHFVNIKYDEEIKKRRLFSRITVGPGERLRTAIERLSMLDLERIHPDLVGIYPLDIQACHDEAFAVEAVTREFYNTFVELFHDLKDEIAGNNPTYQDEAPKEAQMILNRLLFLYFIQKKWWLDNNPHYLYERFQECYAKGPSGYSFYSDFLVRLFQKLSNEQLEFEDLGDVPFLNGGLFEIEPFSSKLPFNLRISNRVFRSIFERLLEHFNFTVREDTPLDIEVAIDPEMLGRIFENLILQLERDRDLRKMTGSYYTPRVIVHFMCQQALREYLASESQVDAAKLEMLSELNPPDQLEDWQADLLKDIVSIPEARLLRDLAKRVFVLDPAVGSGAFLVGILHEMLTLTKYMDVREYGPEYTARRNYDYELKRDIIENCLYGVDILEQAVRICELRLWLSLVVDYEKAPGQEVPPLPNLSYQVRQGDSLIETLFGQRVRIDTLTKTEKGRQLIDEILQEKHAYFLTRSLSEKRQKELSILAKQCELAESLVKERRQTMGTSERLFGELSAKEERENEEVRQRVASLDKLLRSAANAKQKARAWLDGELARSTADVNKLRQELGVSFIWALDFAEVFKAKDGFDIIIGNPPYLFGEFLAESKQYYSKLFSLATGQYDVYWLFYEKDLLQLARRNGYHCFINSDAMLARDEAQRLRSLIVNNTKLCCISHVGEVFESSGVSAVVLLLRVAKSEGYSVQVHPYDLHKGAFGKPMTLPIHGITDDPRKRFSLAVISKSGLLARLKKKSPQRCGDFYRISRGEELGKKYLWRIRDFPTTPKGCVGILAGEGINRFKPLHATHWVSRIDISKDTAIYASPKLVLVKTGQQFVASVDYDNLYTLQSVYNIHPTKHLPCEFLCALLNSKLLNYLLQTQVTAQKKLFPQINQSNVMEMPIVVPDDAILQDIVNRVHLLLQGQANDPSELDLLIYQLFDCTPENIAEVNAFQREAKNAQS